MINMGILMGRVGKKETKPLKNGGEFTLLSVATNKKYKDSSGNYQEQTTWHNVNCFSKLSDIAKKYVHVGDLVFIQGDIQNKKIESGERAGQYIYSIQANEIKFIPKGSKSEDKSMQPEDKSIDKPVFEDNDIPFLIHLKQYQSMILMASSIDLQTAVK